MSDQEDQVGQNKRTVYGPRHVLVQGFKPDRIGLFEPEVGPHCAVYYLTGQHDWGIPVYDHRVQVMNWTEKHATRTRKGKWAEDTDDKVQRLINTPGLATARERIEFDECYPFLHIFPAKSSLASTAVLCFVKRGVLHGKSLCCWQAEVGGAITILTDTDHKAVIMEDDSNNIAAGTFRHRAIAHFLESQIDTSTYGTYEGPFHDPDNYPQNPATTQRELHAIRFLSGSQIGTAETDIPAPATAPVRRGHLVLVSATA